MEVLSSDLSEEDTKKVIAAFEHVNFKLDQMLCPACGHSIIDTSDKPEMYHTYYCPFCKTGLSVG